MEYSDILMHLREILIEQEVIDAETDLSSSVDLRSGLGLDEFKIIELCGEIEDTFGISIPADEAELAQTVGQFVELIQRSMAC